MTPPPLAQKYLFIHEKYFGKGYPSTDLSPPPGLELEVAGLGAEVEVDGAGLVLGGDLAVPDAEVVKPLEIEFCSWGGNCLIVGRKWNSRAACLTSVRANCHSPNLRNQIHENGGN